MTTEQINPTLRFERVYQRNGITVLPELDGDKIRFIEKTTPDDSRQRLALVTGYIENGEEHLDCAKRELAEELHLEAAL